MPTQLPEEMRRILRIEDAAQRRMAVALQASEIGVFEFEPTSEHAFWDDRVFQLWGVEPGTLVTYDTVIGGVHPDDRELHDRSTEEAMDPQGSGQMDMSYRVVPYDGAPMRWIRAVAHCFFEADIPVRLVGTVQDVTAQKAQEERNASLLHELEHRVKNTLATAVAVVDLSRAEHVDIDAYFDVVSARLRSMALSHDVLRRLDWKDAPLRDCVLLEASSFLSDDSDRFSISGPPVRIAANNVLTVGMVFHELFTNAAKYGALANDEGTIELVTETIPGGSRITWSERGGEPITHEPDTPSGFGSVLLTQILPAETKASVTQTFPSDGMQCVIELPSSKAIQS